MFDNYFTQNLKNDETLVKIVHKHWANFLIPLAQAATVTIIPFFLIFFLFSSAWGVIIFFAWVAFGLGYGVFQWLTWYFDSFIITNKRLIYIDQKSLFHRSVSEISVASIQDITYEIKGFLASAFNFGTMRISPASKTIMEVKGVEDPKVVQETIFQLQEKNRAIPSK